MRPRLPVRPRASPGCERRPQSGAPRLAAVAPGAVARSVRDGPGRQRESVAATFCAGLIERNDCGSRLTYARTFISLSGNYAC